MLMNDSHRVRITEKNLNTSVILSVLDVSVDRSQDTLLSKTLGDTTL